MTGRAVSAAAWAIGAEPRPASFGEHAAGDAEADGGPDRCLGKAAFGPAGSEGTGENEPDGVTDRADIDQQDQKPGDDVSHGH